MTNDLTVHGHEPGQVARASESPSMLDMIHQTITSGEVPAEKLPQVLSAFFDFQLKVQAVDAERAFNLDFAAAMLEMPKVAKRGQKKMGEKGTIMYATYEDVDAAIRPVETRHGFARSFSTKTNEKGLCVMTLRLTHRSGHVLTSERVCRPDPGPGRNDIQAEGSGESYGRRYLTLGVWNIVTVGADDDADTADPISETQAMDIRDMLDALAMTPTQADKFWAWAEVPSKRPEDIQKRQHDKVRKWLADRVKGANR